MPVAGWWLLVTKKIPPAGGAGADCINIVQLMASLIESCIHHHLPSPTLGNISPAWHYTSRGIITYICINGCRPRQKYPTTTTSPRWWKCKCKVWCNLKMWSLHCRAGGQAAGPVPPTATAGCQLPRDTCHDVTRWRRWRLRVLWRDVSLCHACHELVTLLTPSHCQPPHLWCCAAKLIMAF